MTVIERKCDKCHSILPAEGSLAGVVGPDRWAARVRELNAEVKAAREQLRGAVSALEEIKRDCGKVCSEFELCDHVACQSSVAAWMIADRYLSGGQS